PRRSVSQERPGALRRGPRANLRGQLARPRRARSRRPRRRIRERRVASRLPASVRKGRRRTVRRLRESARLRPADTRRVRPHSQGRGVPHDLHASGARSAHAPKTRLASLAGAAGKILEGLPANRQRFGRSPGNRHAGDSVFRDSSHFRLAGETRRSARGRWLFSFAPRGGAGGTVLMRILGISAHYHDSAAALLVDGLPVGAIQQERLSRHRNDASFPIDAIEWCLERASLEPSDLDAVVFYEKPMLKFERILTMALRGFPKTW